MTPVEILKAARELIAKPERWTRGHLARDVNGRCAGVFEEGAVCWCAMGAIDKCAGDQDDDAFHRALSLLSGMAGRPVPAFNDSHDHAEVMALFDAAIASAQS